MSIYCHFFKNMLSLMMGDFMKKLTFEEISQDIINKDKYLSLKNDYHHGLTRYIHSIRVAKYTYKITKLLHLNYINATRGALLHDYFTPGKSFSFRMDSSRKVRAKSAMVLSSARTPLSAKKLRNTGARFTSGCAPSGSRERSSSS